MLQVGFLPAIYSASCVFLFMLGLWMLLNNHLSGGLFLICSSFGVFIAFLGVPYYQEVPNVRDLYNLFAGYLFIEMLIADIILVYWSIPDWSKVFKS